MREQLEQRITELEAEQEKGRHMLSDLDARRAELQQTLLRISGAIQVLGELLSGSRPSPHDGPTPGPDGTGLEPDSESPVRDSAAPGPRPEEHRMRTRQFDLVTPAGIDRSANPPTGPGWTP
jgi:uncharacterized coiled-coil protein SlyX